MSLGPLLHKLRAAEADVRRRGLDRPEPQAEAGAAWPDWKYATEAESDRAYVLVDTAHEGTAGDEEYAELQQIVDVVLARQEKGELPELELRPVRPLRCHCPSCAARRVF